MPEEVPLCERLQVEGATADRVAVSTVLCLGTGQGKTLSRVLERDPCSRAVVVDNSAATLKSAARTSGNPLKFESS